MLLKINSNKYHYQPINKVRALTKWRLRIVFEINFTTQRKYVNLRYLPIVIGLVDINVSYCFNNPVLKKRLIP